MKDGNGVSRDRPDRSSQFKIFSGDDDSAGDVHGLWPGMTLSAFYRAYVRPVCLAGAANRNLDQYDQSLGYWERFTGDPPLPQIDAFNGVAFVEALKQLPGRGENQKLASNTVRKHCVHVQYCLDRAGPHSRRQNPLGKGFLSDPPLLVKPAVVRNDEVKNLTLAEIERWIAVCHKAKVPLNAGLPARDWWQSVVVADYNTGLRIETLLALRFSWIVDPEEIEAPRLGPDDKWLRVPAWAIKGRKQARSFFLNAAARSAIEYVRTDRDVIYPWAHTLGHLHACRRELMAEAEIPLRRRFGVGFHGLRKAHGTELGKINGEAVKMSLGHAAGDVTLLYEGREIMAGALNCLPQPVWHCDREGDQRLLF